VVIAVGSIAASSGRPIHLATAGSATPRKTWSDLLASTGTNLADTTVYGGCLFCCNGRGKNPFLAALATIQEWCSSICGRWACPDSFATARSAPVGDRFSAHPHGALALFVEKVGINSALLFASRDGHPT